MGQARDATIIGALALPAVKNTLSLAEWAGKLVFTLVPMLSGGVLLAILAAVIFGVMIWFTAPGLIVVFVIILGLCIWSAIMSKRPATPLITNSTPEPPPDVPRVDLPPPGRV